MTATKGKETVKVAVLGGGLAGLTASYLLSDIPGDHVQFEVHLFEKAPSLGFDAHSVTIPGPNGDSDWRVDVPMRSFQGGYYPQLISFYEHLGVTFRRSNFSYSFSRLSKAKAGIKMNSNDCQGFKITTEMIYNGSSGREGIGIPSSFKSSNAPPKNRGLSAKVITGTSNLISFVLIALQLLFCYTRLIWLSTPFARTLRTPCLGFGTWSEEVVPRDYLCRLLGLDACWREFTQNVLVPLFSAVCTASEGDVLNHPVEEFLDYIWLTLFTDHYVVSKGLTDVVSRLTPKIHYIHLSSPISSIRPDATDPSLFTLTCSTPNESLKSYDGFAHVIFATQANHAATLLSSYRSSLPEKSLQRQCVEDQIRCLETFRYQPTTVVNHMDSTLMPDDPSDRRDLNLVCAESESESESPDETSKWSDFDTSETKAESICVSPSYTMATHILSPPTSRPCHLSTVYQTTNPIIPPRDILSVTRLERAVLTLDAKSALSGLCVQPQRPWWKCAAESEWCLGRLQGGARTCAPRDEKRIKHPDIWFCGSYVHPGIPLLEGCVVSARNVVEQGILRSEGVEVRCCPWDN